MIQIIVGKGVLFLTSPAHYTCGIWLAMETHTMKLLVQSFCADVNVRVWSYGVRRALVTLPTMRLSTRWPCSVTLRGLSLCGSVAVVPAVILPSFESGERKSHNASYYSTTLKLCSVTHTFTDVRKGRPHGSVFVILYTCGNENTWIQTLRDVFTLLVVHIVTPSLAA